MIAIRFDSCINDKKVIKACNEEGAVVARPIDRLMRHATDPEVLEYYFERGEPIFTIDLAMPFEHAACFPDEHPGLIVVAFSRHTDSANTPLKTMTTKAAARILHQFKLRFPDWNSVLIRNRIIKITECEIEIFRVRSGKLSSELLLFYSAQSNWPVALAEFFARDSR